MKCAGPPPPPFPPSLPLPHLSASSPTFHPPRAQADVVAPLALALPDDEHRRILQLPPCDRGVRDAVLLRVHDLAAEARAERAALRAERDDLARRLAAADADAAVLRTRLDATAQASPPATRDRVRVGLCGPGWAGVFAYWAGGFARRVGWSGPMGREGEGSQGKGRD